MEIKSYFWMSIAGLIFSSLIIASFLLGWTPFSVPVFVIVALLFFLFSFQNARTVFWLFLIFLPLEIVVISPSEIPFSLRPFQLTGVILIVVVAFLLFFKKEKSKLSFFDRRIKNGRFSFYDGLVFSFPVFSLLGMINSGNQVASLKQSIILFSFVALYFLARIFLQTKKDQLKAVWFFLIGSTPVLVFGIYQSVAYRLEWKSFQTMNGRVNATFTEPDWLGIYIVVLASIIFWLKAVVYKSEDKEKEAQSLFLSYEKMMIGRWRMMTIVKVALNKSLFLLIFVLLLTVARSDWIGFFMVTFLYLVILFWSQRKSNLMLVLKEIVFEGALVVVLFLFSIAIIELTDVSTFHLGNRAVSSISGEQRITVSCKKNSLVPRHISSVDELRRFSCKHIDLEEINLEKEQGREVKTVLRPDPNVEIRKETYQKTWTEIKKHPFFGQGIGSSGELLGKDDRGFSLNASNIFLETWLSMGLGGLAILILLFVLPFFQAAKNIFYDNQKKFGFSVFVVLGTSSLFIPNFFNSGLFLGFFWILLAVVGLILNNRD